MAADDEPPDGFEEFDEVGGFLPPFARPWMGRLVEATKRSPEPIRRILWVCAPSAKRPARGGRRARTAVRA